MTETLWLVCDAAMVLLLWALGWMACSTQSARRAITLFIAFGLLLALVWARLSAPDLALAEAAIGAGISGALLLAALRDGESGAVNASSATWLAWMINLLTLGLFLVMSMALWQGLQTAPDIELGAQVRALLADSGVSNPVTAVLLNFRAYDTLLELAVVLTAVLGILALGPMRPALAPAGTLLAGLTRWLVPLLIVTSGYLLWVGAHAPGGAFQAGAMLAAAMILLHLARLPGQPGMETHMLRLVLVIGLLVFVGVGLVMMLLNNAFLTYFTASAGVLILLIETAATLSIAAALTLAYIGGRPSGWSQSDPAADAAVPSERAS